MRRHLPAKRIAPRAWPPTHPGDAYDFFDAHDAQENFGLTIPQRQNGPDSTIRDTQWSSGNEWWRGTDGSVPVIRPAASGGFCLQHYANTVLGTFTCTFDNATKTITAQGANFDNLPWLVKGHRVLVDSGVGNANHNITSGGLSGVIVHRVSGNVIYLRANQTITTASDVTNVTLTTARDGGTYASASVSRPIWRVWFRARITTTSVGDSSLATLAIGGSGGASRLPGVPYRHTGNGFTQGVPYSAGARHHEFGPFANSGPSLPTLAADALIPQNTYSTSDIVIVGQSFEGDKVGLWNAERGQSYYSPSETFVPAGDGYVLAAAGTDITLNTTTATISRDSGALVHESNATNLVAAGQRVKFSCPMQITAAGHPNDGKWIVPTGYTLTSILYDPDLLDAPTLTNISAGQSVLLSQDTTQPLHRGQITRTRDQRSFYIQPTAGAEAFELLSVHVDYWPQAQRPRRVITLGGAA